MNDIKIEENFTFDDISLNQTSGIKSKKHKMKKVFIIDNKFNCLSCCLCETEIRIASSKDYQQGCSIHQNCPVFKCRFCEEGKKKIIEEDYKTISNIGNRIPRRELTSRDDTHSRDRNSDRKAERPENLQHSASSSRTRNRTSGTPSNASVLHSSDVRNFSENISSLNQDILKDYKQKVSKLQNELNERDSTIENLKEQVVFLQKENMELKLNSRANSSISSQSVLNNLKNHNEEDESEVHTKCSTGNRSNVSTNQKRRPTWNDNLLNENEDYDVNTNIQLNSSASRQESSIRDSRDSRDFEDNENKSRSSIPKHPINTSSSKRSIEKKSKQEDMESGWNNDFVEPEEKENQPEYMEELVKRPSLNLIQCTNCGKNINQKALDKHLRMCKYSNTFTKNKKTVELKDNMPNSNDWENHNIHEQDNKINNRNNNSKNKNNVNPNPIVNSNDNEIDKMVIKPASKNIQEMADESQYQPSQSNNNNHYGNQYGDKYSEGPSEQETGSTSLIECHSCGRSFNDKAISKHEKICKKVFVEKRKEFNSASNRKPEELIQMENEAKMNKKHKKKNAKMAIAREPSHEDKPLAGNSIPKWKLQSEQFRLAMKVNTGDLTEKEQKQMAKVTEEMDTRKQCPCCSRKFNNEAYTRHYEFCKTKIKKIR